MQDQDFKNKSVDEALKTLEANQNGANIDSAQNACSCSSTLTQEQVAQMAESYAQKHQQAAFNANGSPSNNDNVVLNENEEGNNTVDFASIDDGDPSIANCSTQDDSDLKDQISTLQGQIDILKQQLANEHDKMLRAVAESDNIRKRAAQEVERERKFALEKFVRSLLPIYDALEKALEFSDRNNEATKATIDGVENTLNLFLKELNGFGVELIDPTSQAFDPNFHQAVSMVPTNDLPANHVLSTMQKGFLLNGRVVRPAMVVVSKAMA